MFDLHAAVLWCIHDYPMLSTLLGRTTKGYYACIHYDKNPLSRDKNPIDHIRTTSHVSYMTDAQWNELVQKWLDPKKHGMSYLLNSTTTYC
jgi:hypothetical protein